MLEFGPEVGAWKYFCCFLLHILVRFTDNTFLLLKWRRAQFQFIHLFDRYGQLFQMHVPMYACMYVHIYINSYQIFTLLGSSVYPTYLG